MTFPTLTTDRLILRAFQLTDAAAMLRLRTDVSVMEFMDTSPLKDLDAATRFIQQIHDDFQSKSGINWAISLAGETDMIGYVNYWRMIPAHFRAELGYALLPAFWGKGLMTEAVEAVIAYGFERLNLHSIEANINPDNLPSQRLLERLHFRKEAHFRENYFFDGKFTDSLIYCRLVSDGDGS